MKNIMITKQQQQQKASARDGEKRERKMLNLMISLLKLYYILIHFFYCNKRLHKIIINVKRK